MKWFFFGTKTQLDINKHEKRPADFDFPPKVRQLLEVYVFMAKKRKKQKKYSSEFIIGVILDMREHHLRCCETVRNNCDISKGQKDNYKNIVKR